MRTESRWRPAPLLPADPAGGALRFVIAVLCFLTCVAALGGLASDRAARGWARDLKGEATVQVRPAPGQTPAAAAAAAAEALSAVPGVEEAQALEREKAESLLRPWLGDAALRDLPVPQLVTVSLSRERPATGADLSRALRAAGVDGSVDDHARWLSDVEQAAAIVRAAAAVLFLMALGATGALIGYAARADLDSRRETVEVLHLAGAAESFILSLFQARFARIAAEGGLVGAAAAALVGAAAVATGSAGFAPALPVTWSDLLAVSPCPLLAATVAALAARGVVLRRLRDES